MPFLSRSRFGSQGEVKPKLQADFFRSEKNIVLTVNYVRPVRGQFGDFLAIEFREYLGYEYVTNATQEDALIALIEEGYLDENTDRWGGARIAFRKKVNEDPTTKAPVTKLYAMDPTEQLEAIRLYDENKKAGKDEQSVAEPNKVTAKLGGGEAPVPSGPSKGPVAERREPEPAARTRSRR